MGGTEALLANEAALVADLASQKDNQASGFMNIGRMYLASGRGSEASGYFRLAADAEPDLMETAEFKGVKGVAYAINGQFDLAYDLLRDPGLDNYPDTALWRAYVLAGLQDWPQAAEQLAKDDFSWADDYPDMFSDRLLLSFSEILLRAGRVASAQTMLARLTPEPLEKPYLDYLKGETARQQNKKDEARKIWTKLETGKDDKIRTRARLAIAVLDYESGKTTAPQAIDKLEGLRYAWRGDDLETAIAERLGEIYLTQGDYLRGLQVMRDAATFDPDSQAGKRITTKMMEAFRALFTPQEMKKIDPIDAITVFEKFPELIPVGDDANNLSLNLVDRLIEVDLLDRATKVLQDLVDHKLQGTEMVEAALRLSALHLMNNRPDISLAMLNRTEGMLATIGDASTVQKLQNELALLRARALFKSDRIDQALAVLASLPNNAGALRATADIAWQTGRWGDAARALEALVAFDSLPLNKPPTESQAEIIRNLAVATNLSGDRVQLAALRAQYAQLMSQTELSREFDIITRERQVTTLADRDTLNKLVSEVDLFGGFLESYRGTAPGVATNPPSVSANPPSAPAAAATQ